jgi:hypothetical protein
VALFKKKYHFMLPTLTCLYSVHPSSLQKLLKGSLHCVYLCFSIRFFFSLCSTLHISVVTKAHFPQITKRHFYPLVVQLGQKSVALQLRFFNFEVHFSWVSIVSLRGLVILYYKMYISPYLLFFCHYKNLKQRNTVAVG